MNCIIPFTKDIKFKSNIAEILSISLEHDYTANPEEILGNFIVSGDFKSHEVSINKEHFEYVLPFSVNLTTKIDTDSVDFEIEDFTYDVIDNDTLRVNIEYSINADEVKEEIFEPTTEESLDNLLDEIEDERKSTVEEEEKTIEIEPKKSKNDKEDDRLNEDTQNTILNSINETEDNYVTYNIHIMQESDTLESICLKYNTSQSILSEYNDLSTLTMGDKIIIPNIDE